MILFIDDEKRFSENYIKQLQLNRYKVAYFKDIVKALDFFNNNSKNILLVILDIMMHPGSIFKMEDTEYGLRTGILLYEQIRTMDADIPIIIFTNVTDEKVFEKFQNESNCYYLMKENYLPTEFVEKVKKILK